MSGLSTALHYDDVLAGFAVLTDVMLIHRRSVLALCMSVQAIPETVPGLHRRRVNVCIFYFAALLSPFLP